MQRHGVLAACVFVPTAILAACGSRGPLDGFPSPTIVDAGIADVIVIEDTGSGQDSAPPPVDAAVDAGSGIIQCGTCVATQCGTDVTTCLADPDCQAVIQCVATTCLGLGGGGGGGGGGGIDPTCLLGCSSGGGKGVGEALGVFQCLTSDCGNACGGLLGGLGGLGGFPDPVPPSVPVPANGKHDVAAERAMYVGAFSAWPKLFSEETTPNGQ